MRTATASSADVARQRGLSSRSPVIPLHPFTGLLSLAQERGWNVREVFSCFEFDVEGKPRPGQHCSFLQARELVQHARRLGGPDLPLQSGARKSVANLGIVGLGLMAHGRLGDAMQFGVDFQRLAGAMVDIRLTVDGDEAAIEAQDLFGDDETRAFLQIDHLVTCANALRQLPTDGFVLKRFEVEGELGRGLIEQLERQLGCAVVPHAEATRLVLARDGLQAPLRFNDNVTAELARQACERELRALGLSEPVVSVRAHLLDANGTVRSPADMAREIGISTRTLHRMLAAEGHRYTDLAEQVRIEKARRMLTRGSSTDDVAATLGYSDERSFRRAFERWTGLTPARFRQLR